MRRQQEEEDNSGGKWGLIKTTNFICNDRVNNVRKMYLMRLCNPHSIYIKHCEKSVLKTKGVVK